MKWGLSSAGGGEWVRLSLSVGLGRISEIPLA